MALPDACTGELTPLRAHASYTALCENRNYGQELHVSYENLNLITYRYADAQRQAFVWRRRSRRDGELRWCTETATVDGWKSVIEADHEVHEAWMKVDAERKRQVRYAKRMGTYGGRR